MQTQIRYFCTQIGLVIFLSLCSLGLAAQSSTLSGIIVDQNTGEGLIGVSVTLGEGVGGTTDLDGKFEFNADYGSHTLRISYIGYEAVSREVSISEPTTLVPKIYLQPSPTALDEVVVSVSKFDKRIEQETLSVDVIQSNVIENNNSIGLSEIVEKIPGVQVLDGQASIRGGSGYAYGAGSRVMLVVDGQPLLSADRGDVKWNFVPVENIEQIEVLKGSASLLYGASALNGVIHIKTAEPKAKPETRFNFYANTTDSPRRKESQWWGDTTSAPFSLGTNFSHRQKFKKMDLVLGGNLHYEKGFRYSEDDKWGRINWKTRFRSDKHKNLTYGINGAGMLSKEGLFIIWDNGNEGVLQPVTERSYKYLWYNVDPWMTTFDKNGNKHSLKSRYYGVRLVRPGVDQHSHIFSADYQFAKTFDRSRTDMILGAYSSLVVVQDTDIGDRIGSISALYGQMDQEFGRLSLSGGVRAEMLQLEDIIEVIPSVRLGANYQVAQNTFLRTSYGQGYRMPGMVERYVDYQFSGLINIFSNHDIKPETGWTAEIGVKQKAKISDWVAFADMALFWSEYKNMVEFRFNNWNPTSNDPNQAIGFKSVNIPEVRIAGFEFGLNGNGKIANVPVRAFAGYTYTYPVNLRVDTTLNNFTDYVQSAFDNYREPDPETQRSLLKYRFRHTASADLEADIRKFTIGAAVRHYSFMENIDTIFGILEGFTAFRELNSDPKQIYDVRVAYNFTDDFRLSFISKNILNEEYALRPGILDSPRNFTLQLRYVLGYEPRMTGEGYQRQRRRHGI